MPAALKRPIEAVYRSARYRTGLLRWALMTPEMRQRWTHRRLNLDESEWLFVLGVNNSGTTLLARVLGLHPSVRDLYTEGQRVTQCLPLPGPLGVQRLWSQRIDDFRWTEDHDASRVLRIMYDWAPLFGPGRGYLLEKSPPNTVRSRWLQKNFAPARFIVVTRNPYVVAEGIRRRRNCTIEEAAEHWTTAHRILLKDLPHLQKVLRITYERLCDNTRDVLGEIEEFLELDRPFDRDVLAREFNIHNMQEQPAYIQNFNQRSLDRLSPDQIETVTRIAGDVMQQFGYEPMRASD